MALILTNQHKLEKQKECKALFRNKEHKPLEVLFMSFGSEMHLKRLRNNLY